MPRRQKTAADFPPEFLDAWNLAVQGKLMMTMSDAGMARNMIQRLYVFRKRLMEESPEIAAPFYTVDLRVHDEMGNVVTGRKTAVPGKAIIRPFQSDWKAQIRQQASASGVGLQAAKETEVLKEVLSLPVATPSTHENLVDHQAETLADLGYGTGAKE